MSQIPRWPIYLGIVVALAFTFIFEVAPRSIGAGTSADEVCEVVKQMTDRGYTDADTLLTKFKGMSSDCAAHTVTFKFTVAARGSEAAAAWSMINSTVRKAFCGSSVFKALVGRGWTLTSFYRFTDNSTGNVKVSSCPTTTS
jgi:hypothetical protein